MDIKIAALETSKIISKNVTYGPKKECGKSHIQWMLDGIALGYITDEKAHRWLGWVQAVICIYDKVSLDDMKKINHRA